MAIIVDFFGLPGSGKTTMANALACRYIEEKYGVFKFSGVQWCVSCRASTKHKAKMILKLFRVANVRVFLDIIFMLYNGGGISKDSVRCAVGVWCYFAQIDLILLDDSTRNIYLSDNGIFQTFVSALYNTRIDIEIINECMEHILEDKRLKFIKFVFVTEDTNICLKRIYQRKKNIRVKELKEKELTLELNKEKQIMERVYHNMLINGVSVFSFSSRYGVDDVIDFIK